jgi:DNA-binding CsgD family transcriptional regulator
MGLTWNLGADVIAIVLAIVLGTCWLLRHRAANARAQRLLEDRLRFETLLSDLFAHLVHVETSGLDAALEGALRQMVTFLGVDRGNLDEYVEGTPGIRISWAVPGIEKLPSVLAVSDFVWTADTLRRGGIVRFSRAEELPEAAALDRCQGRAKLLTPRERQVFALVVTGMLNKQIACELGVVEKTVKVHRARVMEKMRAGSVAELVRLADAT